MEVLNPLCLIRQFQNVSHIEGTLVSVFRGYYLVQIEPIFVVDHFFSNENQPTVYNTVILFLHYPKLYVKILKSNCGMIETTSLTIIPFDSLFKPRTPMHIRKRTTLDYRRGRLDACNKLSMEHNLLVLFLTEKFLPKKTLTISQSLNILSVVM
jgi:hypothetical protein